MHRSRSAYMRLCSRESFVILLHLEKKWAILTKVCYRLFIKTLKNYINLWKNGSDYPLRPRMLVRTLPYEDCKEKCWRISSQEETGFSFAKVRKLSFLCSCIFHKHAHDTYIHVIRLHDFHVITFEIKRSLLSPFTRCSLQSPLKGLERPGPFFI